MKDIFRRLDKDNSKSISHYEVQRMKDEGVPEVVVEKICAFLEENDRNKDGEANFQEFLGAVASLDI